MNLEDAINKYFRRESLIDSVSRYQIYYQVGLGHLALKSMQDIDATLKKIEELNLQISTEKVFESIHRIMIHYSHNDNFDEQYNNYLKTEALTQMLNDFIQSDTELIGSEHFAAMEFEKIKNNTFFTQVMQDQFDYEYGNEMDVWEVAITDDVALQIKEVILDRFNG